MSLKTISMMKIAEIMSFNLCSTSNFSAELKVSSSERAIVFAMIRRKMKKLNHVFVTMV